MYASRFVAPGLLGLLVSAPALAQQEGSNPPANPREVIAQLDANGDMVIERDEVPEPGRAAFERLLERGDRNENGKLEGEEIRALLEKLRALGPGPGGAERFRAMDRDGDNKVSRDEFLGPAALFDRIDADSDGFATPEEAARFARTASPEALMARLKAMDRNRDNKISREEFEGPDPVFDRMDSDGDGLLTEPEARRAQAAMASRDRTGQIAPERPDAGRRPTGPDPGQVRRRLQAMDKDGDGKLSREEFQGREPMFSRIDTDGDGSLSREELRAAGERLRGQRQGDRPDHRDGDPARDKPGAPKGESPGR